jgi:hypothetical protein
MIYSPTVATLLQVYNPQFQDLHSFTHSSGPSDQHRIYLTKTLSAEEEFHFTESSPKICPHLCVSHFLKKKSSIWSSLASRSLALVFDTLC